MTQSAGKKLFYADLIRVLAVFMVMLIHSSATLLNKWDKIPFDYWMWGNAYDSLARASVPLFVMLSGALILGKQEDTRSFFKKRFSKLLFPFAFWVAAYINWRIFYIGEVLPVDKLIISIFTGPVYYHLWYLYMVMGLYLVTPVLRKLLKVIEHHELNYLFILWFVWNAVLPLISYLIWLYAGYSVNLGIKIPMVAGYTGYYILGFCLAKKRVSLIGGLGVGGHFRSQHHRYLSGNLDLYRCSQRLSGHPVRLFFPDRYAAGHFTIYHPQAYGGVS
jgi:surface polysaccharide O-acyltransferase-like enzyme